MSIRKPDLKAPRSRGETGYCPITISFWRKFKRETGTKCTYREFADTLKTSNEIISDTIAGQRDGFKLLNHIGTLMLVSCNPIGLENYPQMIDYGRAAKEEVRVKHQNLHSDRKICFILYLTYGVRDLFLNRKLWNFEAVRPLKRLCSKKFREHYELYKALEKFENPYYIHKNEKNILKQIDYAESE